jgi:hypothetical protein
MSMRFVVLVCFLQITAGAFAADSAEVHSEISWALAYETPVQTCKRPKARQSNEVAGQFDRFRRKMEKYTKCVNKYHQLLIEDHQRIVKAAEFGITEQQAQSMIAKVRHIEATVEALGENYSITLNQYDIERFFHVGNRPSI